MNDRLAILGASGHGKVIADAASCLSKWEDIVFYDDAYLEVSDDFPWPVLGNTSDLLHNLQNLTGVVIGIGDNKIRQEKHELLTLNNAPFTTIIHPNAYVSSLARLGLGTVVIANSTVNIGVKTGLSCIVNTNSSIDHDCNLADYVHVSPGANVGGGVTVGERSWIGIGSSVRHTCQIGSDVIVGAGSTVIKTVNDKQIVVGSPAIPLSYENYM